MQDIPFIKPSLLFYDRSVGHGDFYVTDRQGAIARTRPHTNWRASWTRII